LRPTPVSRTSAPPQDRSRCTPGFAFREKAWGVRIEDDILVTPDGHEVLSAAVPKRPDEIESLIRRGRQP